MRRVCGIWMRPHFLRGRFTRTHFLQPGAGFSSRYVCGRGWQAHARTTPPHRTKRGDSWSCIRSRLYEAILRRSDETWRDDDEMMRRWGTKTDHPAGIRDFQPGGTIGKPSGWNMRLPARGHNKQTLRLEYAISSRGTISKLRNTRAHDANIFQETALARYQQVCASRGGTNEEKWRKRRKMAKEYEDDEQTTLTKNRRERRWLWTMNGNKDEEWNDDDKQSTVTMMQKYEKSMTAITK